MNFIRPAFVRLVLVVPLLAAGIALGVPRPAAAATLCGDTPTLSETITGTVKESVVVPQTASCFLSGATVRGGVTVEQDGQLISTSSEIRGSVTGSLGAVIDISGVGGVVRGSITSTNGWYVEIHDTEVRGDVTVIASNGITWLDGSSVRGSATLNSNGNVLVEGNIIEVDLRCQNNGIVSNPGAPNIVNGTKSGDCANLL